MLRFFVLYCQINLNTGISIITLPTCLWIWYKHEQSLKKTKTKYLQNCLWISSYCFSAFLKHNSVVFFRKKTRTSICCSLVIVCRWQKKPALYPKIKRLNNTVIRSSVLWLLSGTGSFEIPVLCLLVHGEPRILKVSVYSFCCQFLRNLRDMTAKRAVWKPMSVLSHGCPHADWTIA